MELEIPRSDSFFRDVAYPQLPQIDLWGSAQHLWLSPLGWQHNKHVEPQNQWTLKNVGLILSASIPSSKMEVTILVFLTLMVISTKLLGWQAL